LASPSEQTRSQVSGDRDTQTGRKLILELERARQIFAAGGAASRVRRRLVAGAAWVGQDSTSELEAVHDLSPAYKTRQEAEC
jgi:hypothetical protein